MRGLFLAALALRIWVPFVPRNARQPEKGIVEGNRAASANKTQKSKQDQQSAETEAIQEILAQITQIQQQQAQDLKNTDGQKDQDAKINGSIKTYTFWLVIVGGVQAFILAGTICALIRQTATMRNSERAWVLVDVKWDSEKWSDRKPHVLQGSGSGGNTTGIYALLICQNEGKSPAWIEEKRAKFEIVSILPLKPNFESAEFIEIGTEPIGIGNAKPPKTHLPWMAEAIGHEETGKMMVVYGIVKYRDIFGKSRATRFGYRITLNREFVRLEGKQYREYNKHT